MDFIVQLHALLTLCHGKLPPSTHSTEDWVGLSAGLNNCRRAEYLAPARDEITIPQLYSPQPQLTAFFMVSQIQVLGFFGTSLQFWGNFC
jgi:hypothetical protein